MGVVTPNISIYIPAAGETNYDAAFAAGMMNIDAHDHTGGPNKGVPIGSGGLADGSVTYQKLATNVADTTTGIGPSGSLGANQLSLLGMAKNLYQLGLIANAGFIAKNGDVVAARTFADSSTIVWSNPAGVAGNPSASLATGVPASIAGTTDQIGVSGSPNYIIALAPIVVHNTQPAFFAPKTSAQNNIIGDGTTFVQINFDAATTNQNSNYAAGPPSRFTAAKTAVYNIGVALNFTGTSTSPTAEIYFYVNGVLAYTLFSDTIGLPSTRSASQRMKLTAADYVEVFVRGSSSGLLNTHGVASGNFTGLLEC